MSPNQATHCSLCILTHGRRGLGETGCPGRPADFSGTRAHHRRQPHQPEAPARDSRRIPSLALFDVALFSIAFALATPSVARAKGLTSPKRQREGCVDQGGAGAALSLALRAGKHRGSRNATSKLALRVGVWARRQRIRSGRLSARRPINAIRYAFIQRRWLPQVNFCHKRTPKKFLLT
jgi:hypothetical protein